MTPAEVGELVKRLLGAFPTQRMKMGTADVMAMTVSYTAGLIDLDYKIASQAVDRAIKTAEWIPPVAKIRAEAGEVVAGPARTGLQAWGDVTRAIGAYGQYRTPVFADPFVREAVERMGWATLCNAPATVSAVRQDFAEIYDSLVAGERKLAQVSPGGATPRQLAARGHETHALGDAVERALRLTKGDTPDE